MASAQSPVLHPSDADGAPRLACSMTGTLPENEALTSLFLLTGCVVRAGRLCPLPCGVVVGAFSPCSAPALFARISVPSFLVPREKIGKEMESVSPCLLNEMKPMKVHT